MSRHNHLWSNPRQDGCRECLICPAIQPPDMEIKEGLKFMAKGYTFHVTQVAGDTVYVRLEGVEWDTPLTKEQVLAAIHS